MDDESYKSFGDVFPLEFPSPQQTRNSTSSNKPLHHLLNHFGKLIAKHTSNLTMIFLQSNASLNSMDCRLILDKHAKLAKQSAANSQNINYDIPAEKLQQIEYLGKGHFGNVHKCKYECEEPNGEITEKYVACKTLINQKKIDFMQEALNMKKLQHDCIVKMIGICRVSAI